MAKKRKKLFRNASLPATLSLSLVLFLVGLLILSLLLARDLSTSVKEKLSVTVLLDENITTSQKRQLNAYLNKAKFVKSKKYISKSDALAEYTEAMGVNPEEILGENPLRATYEIKLLANFANPEDVHKIEKKLLKYKGVVKVNYQDTMIKLVNENINKVNVVLLGLSIVLLLISITLINNMIRIKIYSNRFLINTMKLVGAEPWFICKPYVKSGVVQGIVASIIGFLMLLGLLAYFNIEFGVNMTMVKMDVLLMVLMMMVIVGMILTAISTYLSVRKYVKMRTNDIYIA